MNKLGTQASNF